VSPQPQHLVALAKANRVRFGMAQVKRQIHAGDVELSELFNPTITGDLSVGELLRSFPRWGTTRARSFLVSIGAVEAGPKKTMRPLETVKVRDLTMRERRILADACAATSTISNHLRKDT
jgi:hypothetical protein